MNILELPRAKIKIIREKPRKNQGKYGPDKGVNLFDRNIKFAIIIG